MNRTDIVIVLFLLFIVGVVLVGEAQHEQVVEDNKITYNNDDHMFEYFIKGVVINDMFLNPLHPRRLYNAKCDMGKTYPYSLA